MRAGFIDAPEPYLGLQHYRRVFLTKAPRGKAWRPDVFDIPFWDWSDVGRYGADTGALIVALGSRDYCTAPRIDQRPDGHESLLAQFESRHPRYFLEALDQALHEADATMPSISEFMLQSNAACFFNMFIATNAAANRYADFLWPILERCEQLIGTPEDPYQRRYAGFLAERLQSYWTDLIAPRYGYTTGQVPVGFAPKSAIVNLRRASPLRRAVVRGHLIARPAIDRHLPAALRAPITRLANR